MDAYNNLSPSSFGLYLYLARISTTSTTWFLSRTDVKNKLNMGDTTYDNAVKELKDKHYLVEVGHNDFEFYTMPKNNIPENRDIPKNGDNIIPKNGEDIFPENWERTNNIDEDIYELTKTSFSQGECPLTPTHQQEEKRFYF